MAKKLINFRLEDSAIADLDTIAKIHTRNKTNMIEVLISDAKKDLQERGKWPVKG